MTLRSGFFNSINGDRKYDALDMSSIFDGIIEDGVFATIGNHFSVAPSEGLHITVDTGKAWFNHTWTVNDALIPYEIEEPDVTLSRIDAVVLEINLEKGTRQNSIKIVKGSHGLYPEKPVMVKTDEIIQHPLAYVTVRNSVSEITAGDIEMVVGTSECPFVTGPLETVPIDDLFDRWEHEFQVWFEDIQTQLGEDVAGNLLNLINQRVKYEDKASDEDLSNGTPDKWVDSQILKTKSGDYAYRIGDILNTLRTDLGEKWALCNGDPVNADEYPDLAKLMPDIAVLLEGLTDVSFAITGSSQPIRIASPWTYKSGIYTTVEGVYQSSPSRRYTIYTLRTTDDFKTVTAQKIGTFTELEPHLCKIYALNDQFLMTRYGVVSKDSIPESPILYVSSDGYNWSNKTLTLDSGSSSIAVGQILNVTYRNGNYIAIALAAVGSADTCQIVYLVSSSPYFQNTKVILDPFGTWSAYNSRQLLEATVSDRYLYIMTSGGVNVDNDRIHYMDLLNPTVAYVATPSFTSEFKFSSSSRSNLWGASSYNYNDMPVLINWDSSSSRARIATCADITNGRFEVTDLNSKVPGITPSVSLAIQIGQRFCLVFRSGEFVSFDSPQTLGNLIVSSKKLDGASTFFHNTMYVLNSKLMITDTESETVSLARRFWQVALCGVPTINVPGVYTYMKIKE